MIEKVDYQFDEERNTLLKNGKELFSGIGLFEIFILGRNLDIEIVSLNRNEKKESIHTEIYLRKGVDIEIPEEK